jgi:SAM-dependent methyltransferase
MTKMDPDIARHYGHFYDSGATEWRRLGARDKARNVVDLCCGRGFSNVLEIGAGDGAVLQELSDSGFATSYSALEVSDSAISVIQERGIAGLREATLFDGYSAPVDSSSYDLAICSHVVEHVEHPRMLLKEASRLADYVFVEVPLELKLRTPRNYKWTDTGHINIYSPLTIRHLLQTTGLEVVEERISNPSIDVYKFAHERRGPLHWAVKSMWLRTVPFLATRLFSYHWSALCRPARDEHRGPS